GSHLSWQGIVRRKEKVNQSLRRYRSEGKNGDLRAVSPKMWVKKPQLQGLWHPFSKNHADPSLLSRASLPQQKVRVVQDRKCQPLDRFISLKRRHLGARNEFFPNLIFTVRGIITKNRSPKRLQYHARLGTAARPRTQGHHTIDKPPIESEGISAL